MRINRVIARFLFSIICAACLTLNTVASPIGLKLGIAASSFNYTDRGMDPYLGLDIDLRPYLGYDIQWVQLGDQNPLYAPFVSLCYSLKFSDKLFLRPEIGITQKGVNFNQFDYQRTIYEVRITYLNNSLALGYQLLNNYRFALEAYGGGTGALKLDAYKKVAHHQSPIEKQSLDNVRNYDFSLFLGIDVKWKIFNKNLMLDIQSFYGLTNIFYPIKNQPQLYRHTQQTKNAGLLLSLGYEFTK